MKKSVILACAAAGLLAAGTIAAAAMFGGPPEEPANTESALAEEDESYAEANPETPYAKPESEAGDNTPVEEPSGSEGPVLGSVEAGEYGEISVDPILPIAETPGGDDGEEQKDPPDAVEKTYKLRDDEEKLFLTVQVKVPNDEDNQPQIDPGVTLKAEEIDGGSMEGIIADAIGKEAEGREIITRAFELSFDSDSPHSEYVDIVLDFTKDPMLKYVEEEGKVLMPMKRWVFYKDADGTAYLPLPENNTAYWDGNLHVEFKCKNFGTVGIAMAIDP